MPNEQVQELVRILSLSRVVLSGDVKPELLEGIDIDVLANRIISSKKESAALLVIKSDDIIKELEEMGKVDKAPLPIEVIRSSDFKPFAMEMDANYSINNRKTERTEGTASDFVNYFRSRLAKIKTILESHAAAAGLLRNLEALKGLTDGREVSIVGIVADKFVTKKGNVMLVLEDETGEAKVMFMNGTGQKAKELFENGGKIINDEVVAITGKISGPFVIANQVLWPDIPIRTKKNIEDDIAIAFMSDIHVGSKRFMQKNFESMIKWLNGNGEQRHKELAGKVKYIVMAGDVADGVGIYPGQDRDLAILDLYAQYQELFNYIDAIPDYIHVFLLPGNHDAVQRAEPQPPLGSDILKGFKRDNVHIISNPSYVTAHGLDILAYHGTALDSVIAAIPGMSYAHPEKVMIEMLKRRHLSPVYGGNVIVPSREDNLVIDKVPDILHMGHIHKNGISSYHGVEIVNSGTWQARTDYQIMQGHIPTPCVLPVYEAKSKNFTSISFGEQ